MIAIQNAKMFRETNEALERQTATAEILKVIAGSPSDVQPVFDAIARSSNQLLGGWSTMVARIEDDALHLVAFTSTTPEGDAALRRSFPIALNAFPVGCGHPPRRDRPHRRHRSGCDEGLQLLRELARVRGYRSMLFCPLVREGQSIGMISVTRREPGPFAPHQVALLQTFADQAVIAIENVRLFNETQESLQQQKASAEVLAVISNSMADAQPVFEKILDSCKHLFGGDELDVLLVDEQGMLNIAAYRGVAHDIVAATFPAPVERTPAGRALRERRVMHWPDLIDGDDVPGVLRKMAKLIGYRSMVFAPMLWNERGIGAIGVARSTGPFKPKELAMLQTFADQAVIAIQNARLFNETQEALEQQTATRRDPARDQPVARRRAAGVRRHGRRGGQAAGDRDNRRSAAACDGDHLLRRWPGRTPDGPIAAPAGRRCCRCDPAANFPSRTIVGARPPLHLTDWQRHRSARRTSGGIAGRRSACIASLMLPLLRDGEMHRRARLRAPNAQARTATRRSRCCEAFARPGGDRDRERAPVQRDQGSAGAADGHGRGAAGHRQLDGRPATRVRAESSVSAEDLFEADAPGHLPGARRWPHRPSGSARRNAGATSARCFPFRSKRSAVADAFAQGARGAATPTACTATTSRPPCAASRKASGRTTRWPMRR